MADVSRQRENLQDIETIRRLRELKTRTSVALAYQLEIALYLRDATERCGADATAVLAKIREHRSAAAKLLYEDRARLIAVPLRRLPELRLVAP